MTLKRYPEDLAAVDERADEPDLPFEGVYSNESSKLDLAFAGSQQRGLIGDSTHRR